VSFLFLLFAAISIPAVAADDHSYLNTGSFEAKKNLSRILAANPLHLPTDAERAEWAKARLAAISLARLQAREADAIQLFEGCGTWCGKYGPEAEWRAVKAWGCQKKREAKPCLPLSSSSVKTKAQKPPL
jgi:hypothetical protein